MINRDGHLKLVSGLAGGWSIERVNKEQKLDVSDTKWRVCSLVFSSDGHRALALDSTGKLLVTDFVEWAAHNVGSSTSVYRRGSMQPV